MAGYSCIIPAHFTQNNWSSVVVNVWIEENPQVTRKKAFIRDIEELHTDGINEWAPKIVFYQE